MTSVFPYVDNKRATDIIDSTVKVKFSTAAGTFTVNVFRPAAEFCKLNLSYTKYNNVFIHDRLLLTQAYLQKYFDAINSNITPRSYDLLLEYAYISYRLGGYQPAHLFLMAATRMSKNLIKSYTYKILGFGMTTYSVPPTVIDYDTRSGSHKFQVDKMTYNWLRTMVTNIDEIVKPLIE